MAQRITSTGDAKNSKKKNKKKSRAKAPGAGGSATPSKKPKLRPYTLEEMRTAVLHLVELAATRDGLGLDLAGPDDDAAALASAGWPLERRNAALTADEECLAAVVQLLIDHRREQRRHQRDSLFGHLLTVLPAPVNTYMKAVDDALAELRRGRHRRDEKAEAAIEAKHRATAQKEVERLLRGLFIEPTARNLDDLVGSHRAVRDEDGAAESIKERLGGVVGLGSSMMGIIKRAPHVLDDARYSFGRFFWRQARAKYVRFLHEEVGSTTERGRIPLRELRDFPETAGQIQDRRAESVIRMLCDDPTLIAAYLRSQLIAAAEQGRDVSELPDVARARVEECVAARARGDRDAARSAASALEKLLSGDADAFAHELRRIQAGFGDFDPLPPLPDGAGGVAADPRGTLLALLEP